MATQTKTLADVTTVTTAADTLSIPLIGTNGATSKITVANLRKAINQNINLNAIEDGVFIYTVDSSGTLRNVRPSKWAQYKSSGYTPIGISVLNGDKSLVVALTEATSTMNWSSGNVTAGGTNTSNRRNAMADWNGESNATAQVTHAECNGTGYAPGYCHNFSCLNSDNKGIAAGQWHLPSLAELLMIYANFNKINYALSLLDGTMQLQETGYWSSTEGSATNAWYVYFGRGSVYFNYKSTNSNRVRPVAAFQ